MLSTATPSSPLSSTSRPGGIGRSAKPRSKSPAIWNRSRDGGATSPVMFDQHQDRMQQHDDSQESRPTVAHSRMLSEAGHWVGGGDMNNNNFDSSLSATTGNSNSNNLTTVSTSSSSAMSAIAAPVITFPSSRTVGGQNTSASKLSKAAASSRFQQQQPQHQHLHQRQPSQEGSAFLSFPQQPQHKSYHKRTGSLDLFPVSFGQTTKTSPSGTTPTGGSGAGSIGASAGNRTLKRVSVNLSKASDFGPYAAAAVAAQDGSLSTGPAPRQPLTVSSTTFYTSPRITAIPGPNSSSTNIRRIVEEEDTVPTGSPDHVAPSSRCQHRRDSNHNNTNNTSNPNINLQRVPQITNKTTATSSTIPAETTVSDAKRDHGSNKSKKERRRSSAGSKSGSSTATATTIITIPIPVSSPHPHSNSQDVTPRQHVSHSTRPLSMVESTLLSSRDLSNEMKKESQPEDVSSTSSSGNINLSKVPQQSRPRQSATYPSTSSAIGTIKSAPNTISHAATSSGSMSTSSAALQAMIAARQAQTPSPLLSIGGNTSFQGGNDGDDKQGTGRRRGGEGGHGRRGGSMGTIPTLLRSPSSSTGAGASAADTRSALTILTQTRHMSEKLTRQHQLQIQQDLMLNEPDSTILKKSQVLLSSSGSGHGGGPSGSGGNSQLVVKKENDQKLSGKVDEMKNEVPSSRTGNGKGKGKGNGKGKSTSQNSISVSSSLSVRKILGWAKSTMVGGGNGDADAATTEDSFDESDKEDKEHVVIASATGSGARLEYSSFPNMEDHKEHTGSIFLTKDKKVTNLSGTQMMVVHKPNGATLNALANHDARLGADMESIQEQNRRLTQVKVWLEEYAAFQQQQQAQMNDCVEEEDEEEAKRVEALEVKIQELTKTHVVAISEKDEELQELRNVIKRQSELVQQLNKSCKALETDQVQVEQRRIATLNEIEQEKSRLSRLHQRQLEHRTNGFTSELNKIKTEHESQLSRSEQRQALVEQRNETLAQDLKGREHRVLELEKKLKEWERYAQELRLELRQEKAVQEDERATRSRVMVEIQKLAKESEEQKDLIIRLQHGKEVDLQKAMEREAKLKSALEAAESVAVLSTGGKRNKKQSKGTVNGHQNHLQRPANGKTRLDGADISDEEDQDDNDDHIHDHCRETQARLNQNWQQTQEQHRQLSVDVLSKNAELWRAQQDVTRLEQKERSQDQRIQLLVTSLEEVERGHSQQLARIEEQHRATLNDLEKRMEKDQIVAIEQEQDRFEREKSVLNKKHRQELARWQQESRQQQQDQAQRYEQEIEKLNVDRVQPLEDTVQDLKQTVDECRKENEEKEQELVKSLALIKRLESQRQIREEEVLKKEQELQKLQSTLKQQGRQRRRSNNGNRVDDEGHEDDYDFDTRQQNQPNGQGQQQHQQQQAILQLEDRISVLTKDLQRSKKNAKELGDQLAIEKTKALESRIQLEKFVGSHTNGKRATTANNHHGNAAWSATTSSSQSPSLSASLTSSSGDPVSGLHRRHVKEGAPSPSSASASPTSSPKLRRADTAHSDRIDNNGMKMNRKVDQDQLFDKIESLESQLAEVTVQRDEALEKIQDLEGTVQDHAEAAKRVKEKYMDKIDALTRDLIHHKRLVVRQEGHLFLHLAAIEKQKLDIREMAKNEAELRQEVLQLRHLQKQHQPLNNATLPVSAVAPAQTLPTSQLVPPSGKKKSART